MCKSAVGVVIRRLGWAGLSDLAPFGGDNMLKESTIEAVLEALSDAGLCVCEASIIGTNHPGLLPDDDDTIGRIEECGGLSE